MSYFKNFYLLILKGMGMGAANVIPGVSGGTIAFITGIYEELIDSLKSLDLKAVQLLFKGKFRDLSDHIHLPFLMAIFIGVGVSIISLAKLLEYLFLNYAVLVWSFFFGLIIASIYFVGKTINRWDMRVIISLLLGAAIAIGISLFKPATANDSFFYLFLCGIVAISSMILPGLSGSYILIIMGNYMLILGAVKDLDIGILIPLALGCVFGLIAFSHVLSWVFKHFREETIGLLTGFILGSLAIIWPWKSHVYLMDEAGIPLLKDGEQIINGYNWHLPKMLGGTLADNFGGETIIALGLILLGFAFIALMERFGANKPEEFTPSD